MRIAIISDVHGNLTAFDAVVADIERRAPDLVLHGGDLVLMGPEPAEVVDRVRELGWPGVVGNTDEVLWRPEEQSRQRERAPKLHPLLGLIFDEYAPGELGIDILRFEHTFYCSVCGGMASMRTCPHPAEQHRTLSGTAVRKLLDEGVDLPPEFTRPEVARVLHDAAKEEATA